ncbi:MAG TPA: SAM-dependent methyltransferase [Candidatus Onthousia faecavium]|nr:SAM-dependent methyltransferase [Candidatus Onthousia faecavium]
MKINERLKKIGDLVPLSSYPLDIGCDHALLTIYLTKERSIEKALAADNKEGPLQMAKVNIANYHLEDKIELILADGLDAYRKGVSVVTISGMGGLTINKIIDKGRKYLKYINTFILSPNNYTIAVKRKLKRYGYYISDEYVVKDKNKIYQIMVFTKGKKYYSYKKLFLGPVLMTRREPLVKEYYLNELKMKQQLLKIMPSSFTSKRRLLKREIKYLEAIIKEI